MSIEKNIKDIQKAVEGDPKKGNKLKQLAVKAIYAGFGTDAWNEYMQQFAHTPQELARLTTRASDHCSVYIEPARAYLVGNATCLPGSRQNLLQGIEGFLDKTLQ
jgi:hypothetical protein